MEVVCKNCGERYIRKPSSIKNLDNFYCGKPVCRTKRFLVRKPQDLRPLMKIRALGKEYQRRKHV